jgi:glycosyltransferase involved in cell wall biosynthesis
VTTTPELSVIFPTFNRGWVLGRTLEMLRAQDVSSDRYEVIVVDGGSTDGSVSELETARDAGPFRLIRQSRGARTAARNEGAAAARGRLLLFMDSDVWATPSLIATHLARHAAGGDLGVQGPSITHPDSLRNMFMRASNVWPDLSVRRREGISPFLVRTRNFSVRADAFWRAGGFDEGFAGYGWEDIELAVRLVRGGVTLVWEPSAISYHHHVMSLEEACARQYDNGVAAVYFWRKHGRERGLGLLLEIHPALLPLKWLVFRSGILSAVLPPFKWLGERLNIPAVCGEVYNNLLWRAYYRGVFEALRAPA